MSEAGRFPPPAVSHTPSAIMQRRLWIRLLDLALRSYGLILFTDRAWSGLVLLAVTMGRPVAGLMGLLGLTVATLIAYLLRPPPALFWSGLFGCNGALLGLSWSLYLEPTAPVVALLVVTAALSSVALLALYGLLSLRLDLPVLSLPFVAVAWLGMLTLEALPQGTVAWRTIGIASGPFVASGSPLGAGLASLGCILFQPDAVAGTAGVIAMLFHSRLSAAFALLGAFGGIAVLRTFEPSGSPELILTAGFNCALIAVALGGVLVVLNRRSVLYVVLGVVAGAFVTVGLSNFLQVVHLPVLAAPFNIVTLVLLVPMKAGLVDPVRSGLRAVALAEVRSPEETRLAAALHAAQAARRRRVQLSLPFFGEWLVTQGPNGRHTHKGDARHAWDFSIADEDNLTFRTTGRETQDYYCFGLPVLAPADGLVVKVVADVPDNVPPRTNRTHNWGNYVILEHAEGEYSEISHFRRYSISVYEGQVVARGQLIGYCGNSGRSSEPHLHLQLQDGPFAGAASQPAAFCAYTARDSDSLVLKVNASPAEGERVANYERAPSPELTRLFPLDSAGVWRYSIRAAGRWRRLVEEQWALLPRQNDSVEVVMQSRGRSLTATLTRTGSCLNFALPAWTLGQRLPSASWVTVLDWATYGMSVLPLSFDSSLTWVERTRVVPVLGWWARIAGRRGIEVVSRFAHGQPAGEPDRPSSPEAHNRLSSVAEEKVAVPAGTFHCVRVASQFHSLREGQPHRELGQRELWLAEGVGIVKVAVQRKHTRPVIVELADFQERAGRR